MSSVPNSLKKLQEIAPELNRVADSAAKIVQEVETMLTKLGIGVSASALVGEFPKSPKVREITNLAYGRISGKFRIAVVVEKEVDYDAQGGGEYTASNTISETPWLECPRDVKLATFPFLPALLQELIKNAESAKANVEKAQEAIRALLGDKGGE